MTLAHYTDIFVILTTINLLIMCNVQVSDNSILATVGNSIK